MLLFDDWKGIARTPGQKGAGSQLPAGDDICRKLNGFKPTILNVHCYEDVRYPWVQVVFDQLIHPSVALLVGKALAEVDGMGGDCVYLNSLRPMAVYFLLDLVLDENKKPELPISRYGTPLADVTKCWSRPNAVVPAKGARAQVAPPVGRPASRRQPQPRTG